MSATQIIDLAAERRARREAPAPSDHQIARLAGRHVLVLNWRDVRHPQAGGAEQYMHEIARRWVAAGVRVTWYAARPEGLSRREVVDGIEIVRCGGELTLYPRVLARLARTRGRFDAIVDCQNGIPFFSPLVAGDLPVLQVLHHVHQDQFATRFPAPLAALGRFLEGRAARRVYGRRTVAAVSPSTRRELRRRLGFRGPVAIVPNGSAPLPTRRPQRAAAPTVAVVSRLVPHKRVDVLLGQVAEVARAVPGLQVDIVGDGPERPRLEALVAELGLSGTVTLRGFAPDEVRDAIVGRAWVTTSTSDAEGWGCTVVEAAAHGVPCVAVDVPGIRDSVVDGVTGRLVPDVSAMGAAITEVLRELADDDRATVWESACREWAGAFTWERSADLLAGALLADARPARSDLATVARFRRPAGVDAHALTAGLRSTDQVHVEGNEVAVLLTGCDETDAAAVLARLGVTGAQFRLAEKRDLLAGPSASVGVAA
ncbi:glycosyltransferase family 4 protein [Actinomycetospora flava]|uniref:Glycosyltransferase family 4 protein n=1 Tax=Actinomycetospora flava TaxID=3129232 RepID=A0ABU8M3B9_9PSEU